VNSNLTLSEILTIAIVILIVFGPQRLPEMARKAGEIVGKLRDSAATLRNEFTQEYEDVAKPLKDIEADLRAAKADLRGALPDLSSLDRDTPGTAPRSRQEEHEPEPGTESAPDEDG
jgi:sec-independent protein translocase protein TatB